MFSSKKSYLYRGGMQGNKGIAVSTNLDGKKQTKTTT